ncbi:hypothetical protein ACFUTV_24330 [Streptomyces sp. NPDC057298]|uniref:hypothetical protein n=1 Tax=Streptomyces sp. NPDC057298 TaxID=3346091 RepID=UPI003640486A
MTSDPTPSQAEGERADGAEDSPVGGETGRRQVPRTTPSQAEGDRDDETPEE